MVKPVDAAWVRAQVNRLGDLVQRDPVQAKVEVGRHSPGRSS